MSFWKRTGDTSEKLNIESESRGPLVVEGVVSSTKSSESRSVVAAPEPQQQSKATNTDDVLGERFGRVRSALSSGTVIQGKLSFDTPVRIDGKLSGEVFSSRALIVGNTGQVDARLEVATLVVLGSLKGNVKAMERIEVWAGGSLEGDIAAPVFVLQEGATFNGSCKQPAVIAESSSSEKGGKNTDAEQLGADGKKDGSEKPRGQGGAKKEDQKPDAGAELPLH